MLGRYIMNKKVAIIYYSFSGNTRGIAERIAKAIGADVFAIDTVKPYTGSYQQVVDQAHKEIAAHIRPEIKPVDIDLSQYDAVVLASPVWWYTYAPAMGTFLDRADLAGKDVYAFATNEGGLGHTLEDFKKAVKGANVHEGLNVRFSNGKQVTTDQEILTWAKAIK